MEVMQHSKVVLHSLSVSKKVDLSRQKELDADPKCNSAKSNSANRINRQ